MTAHWRNRGIERLLKQSLTWAPSLSIVGMRQVGKSALTKKFSDQYFTFDDDAFVGKVNHERSSLLRGGPYPIGLDEVQKFPAIFDMIKLLIDEQRVPGRFILTGSVRFASKRGIRESLTGRNVVLEMFPFTLAECHKQQPSSFLQDMLNENRLEKTLSRRESKLWSKFGQVEEYFQKGGLPGIFSQRDKNVRQQMFSQHLDTLLGRDIQFLVRTKMDVGALRDLFFQLVALQGLSYNVSNLARMFGYSSPSMRKIIDAFVGLYLLRPHGSTYYVEDQGLASYAGQIINRTELSILEGFVYHELRVQKSLMPEEVLNFGAFATRGGASVPFVFERTKGHCLAIALTSETKATEKNLKSLRAFRKHIDRPARLVALHCGDNFYMADKDVLCMPLHWIV